MSLNILGAAITVQERWIKLYRSLFHNFLKKDFVELEDFKMMHQQLNLRITELETALNANIAATNASISMAIVTHTHNAPQAPAGILPTTVGILQGSLSAPVAAKTPETIFIDTMMRTKDAAYVSLGPAMAPLGDGLSFEASKSTAKAISDIGAI